MLEDLRSSLGWWCAGLVHPCVDMRMEDGALVCRYAPPARTDPERAGRAAFSWICCGVNDAWVGGILWGEERG